MNKGWVIIIHKSCYQKKKKIIRISICLHSYGLTSDKDEIQFVNAQFGLLAEEVTARKEHTI